MDDKECCSSISGNKSVKQVQKIALLRSVYILKFDFQENLETTLALYIIMIMIIIYNPYNHDSDKDSDSDSDNDNDDDECPIIW